MIIGTLFYGVVPYGHSARRCCRQQLAIFAHSCHHQYLLTGGCSTWISAIGVYCFWLGFIPFDPSNLSDVSPCGSSLYICMVMGDAVVPFVIRTAALLVSLYLCVESIVILDSAVALMLFIVDSFPCYICAA